MSILYDEIKVVGEDYSDSDYIHVYAEQLKGELDTYQVITVSVKTTIDGGPTWIRKSKIFVGTNSACTREAIRCFDELLANHPNKELLK